MSIGHPIEEQAESHSFTFQMRKIMTDEMNGAYEINRLLSGFGRCKASALLFLARRSLETIAAGVFHATFLPPAGYAKGRGTACNALLSGLLRGKQLAMTCKEHRHCEGEA
ncbi:MAG: hypothetical protein LBM08_01880 [Dysgonamonadaceae bacterium]|jgi:hypothetical protein|nr:hypothetical protein [Dysgonamonadaceae bacterium]